MNLVSKSFSPFQICSLILLSFILSANVALFCMMFKNSVENNGGPRNNNFGMVNALGNMNSSKVVDNDNNNNINLPNLFLNGTNNTINIRIINYNLN